MLDGILLEKTGIPSASIVTDVFERTGRAMAEQWGLPRYKFLAMPHPIANLTGAQLDQPQILETPLLRTAEDAGVEAQRGRQVAHAQHDVVQALDVDDRLVGAHLWSLAAVAKPGDKGPPVQYNAGNSEAMPGFSR